MTMLSGAFATSNLDTAGEKIDIEGLDISSLCNDGKFIFEHKKDLPTQIVGRVTFAKKIFKASDCDDSDQLKYWDRILLPFLYGRGELFDTVGHEGALALSAILKHDLRQGRPANERALICFSIDGQILEKQNNIIKFATARDVAVTLRPASKTALASLYTPEPTIASPLDAIKSLFKNEHNEGEVLTELDIKVMELEALLKTDDISEFAKGKISQHLAKVKPQAGTIAPIQKEVNGRPSANLGRKPILPPKESLPWVPKASIAPRTKESLPNPKGLTSQTLSAKVPVVGGDEFKAKIQAFKEKAAKSNMEAKAPYKGKLSDKTSVPTVAPKIEAPKTVAQTIASPITPPKAITPPMAASIAPKQEANGEPKAAAPTHFEVKSKAPKLDAIRAKSGPIMVPMSKAETAGTIVGPGSNTGFAALAGTDLKKQADDIYNKWDKKEDFEQFLSSRLPKMSKNEIKALAKMYSVATTQKKEELLKNI